MTEKPHSAGDRPDGSADAGQESSTHELAENVGRSLGRLARTARARARAAQPEAERLARQARDAAEAAMPHVRRAGREAAARAGQFVRENQDDIRRATTTGAGLAAGRSPVLRPVIFAVADEVTRKVAGFAETSTTDDPAAQPPVDPAPDSPSEPEPPPRPNLF